MLIQGCLLEAALGERIGVSDDEWELIGPLLPSERGRGCRPAQDNRRYFEGMMWIARTGAQWRHCRMSMASGTASSGATEDGSRPVCSMPCSRRWPNWRGAISPPI
ncbi:transposase [Brevundimonas denitrificans]|uniref:transposase n=1 Tax=Brevundimonas denitrificans TaxID=1443434 RepID=UPI00352EDAAF